MSSFNRIIPLGETCNITFLSQNCKIKKETSLFEWFVTTNLNSITKIVNKLADSSHVTMIQEPNSKNIFIEDSTISSIHYTLEELKPIFERRSIRFLESIRDTTTKSLFVRFEIRLNVHYTYDDIEQFVHAIQRINPSCEGMKLLLISPTKDHIKHPFILNEFYEYEDIHSDPYCKGSPINTFFVNTLKKYGFDMNSVSHLQFHDKSDS
jgi:hypothetical protein